MKLEPKVDHSRLLAVVRDEYRIEAEELEFVPVGYVAVCYAVLVSGAPRYFLKLWPNTAVARENLPLLDPSLRITRALYDRRLFPRVSYPLPTRNQLLRGSYAGQPFAVFPYLAGSPAPPWEEMSVALRDSFARVVAEIHRATPYLADVLPPRDNFDVPFEPALREGLGKVERIGPGARPSLQSLRAAVLPRRDEIAIQLERLHRLQRDGRARSGPLVLVHGDHGGDNLLIDDVGQLWVLDWDGAAIGPPEFDFLSALGDGFARFLTVYREAGGSGPWQLDNVAFAILRRGLGDFTARLVQILEDDCAEDEANEALQGMETWGFARWRGLDQNLETIDVVLKALAR